MQNAPYPPNKAPVYPVTYDGTNSRRMEEHDKIHGWRQVYRVLGALYSPIVTFQSLAASDEAYHNDGRLQLLPKTAPAALIRVRVLVYAEYRVLEENRRRIAVAGPAGDAHRARIDHDLDDRRSARMAQFVKSVPHNHLVQAHPWSANVTERAELIMAHASAGTYLATLPIKGVERAIERAKQAFEDYNNEYASVVDPDFLR